ncbi:MAG: acid phosphatase [Micavibrio aeruginosavorus]|uniref:Acid phosphatase n=1 Tax=Micavibrio aeruginosavorus TaxID=349221 RepID=A0A2W5FR25_9BACT|nr:MAG: acid phosphatase [Micavibrio aeruginosavorus]
MHFVKPVFLAILVSCFTACATAPQNIGELKTQVTQYKESGKYEHDFNVVIGKAERHIIAQSSKVKNPAIVLDIDETSLSNWPQLKANDYAFYLPGPCENLEKGPCGLDGWKSSGKAKAFSSTLRLFETAKSQNISVFFITGRMERERAVTESNLKDAGYHGWSGLVLRASGTKTATADLYKAPERAKIEARGFTIIANIGDQPSDLKGGGAHEKDFLLPNPFYRIK